MESTIRTLQEQTHTANHKNSMYEIAIRNLTQERDSAISQLSVAYLTTEQLKAENERLVEANMLMRSKFSQSKLGEETDTQHLTQREEGLYTKNQRRDRALEEPHEQSRKPVRPQRAGPKASRDDGRSQEDRKTTSASEIKLPETHTGETEVLRKRKTRMVLEEYSESETTNDSIDGASIEVDQTDGHARPLTREVEHPDTVHATTGDMTFLSFLEVRLTYIVFWVSLTGSRVEKSPKYARRWSKNELPASRDLEKAAIPPGELLMLVVLVARYLYQGNHR